MKRLITSAAILAALLVAVCLNADFSFAQKGSEKSKSSNDQVKLYSNAVEVVEVKPEGEKCGKDATTLRLRVTSDSPVDVRVYFQKAKGGWASSDYTNKKKGDEIVSTECRSNAKYKVQTRPAGTNKWPNL